jgi:hypothetical protein
VPIIAAQHVLRSAWKRHCRDPESGVGYLYRTKIDGKFDMPLSGAAAEGVVSGYALFFNAVW